MKIAIDFDGVLVQHSGIFRGNDFTHLPPVKDSREAVLWLMERFEVYVLTSRPSSDWRGIRKWLKKWGFPEIPVGNTKYPRTKLIIDDRAVRFDNWVNVCKLLG